MKTAAVPDFEIDRAFTAETELHANLLYSKTLKRSYRQTMGQKCLQLVTILFLTLLTDLNLENLGGPSTPLSVVNAAIPTGLHHPLETADPGSPECLRFLEWTDQAVDNPQYPPYAFSAFHAALAYKLTGTSAYADLAISIVDQTVNSAKAAAANANAPAIAYDTYSGVFRGIKDVTFTLQWCDARISTSQKTAWRDYCNQAIKNLQAPKTATWYGKLLPIDGTMPGPGNSTFYSHLGATVCWAAFSGNKSQLDRLNTTLWPKLVNYLQILPEGGSREGTAYGLNQGNLFEAYGIWAASTGGDIQSQTTHCRNSISYWVHATTPGGRFNAPIGDQAPMPNAIVEDGNRMLINAAMSLNAGDPIAEAGHWWNQSYYPKILSGFNLPNDLQVVAGEATQPTELSYFAKGAGHYFARSDWSTDATFLNFTCGTYSEAHGHQNHGAFDIWGTGGWLAVTENTLTESGAHGTPEFHNMLRFEKQGAILKQVLGKAGTATAVDDGTTVVADLLLSPLYPNQGIQWSRNLRYARPSTLTVTDNFIVPIGVLPVFQLQLPVKPVVRGNGLAVGKLKVTVVSPARASIAVQDWTKLATDALTGWRVDITDPAGGKTFVVKFEVLPNIIPDDLPTVARMLHHPLETASPTSADGVRFLKWVDNAVANPQNPPQGFRAFHGALAYKLTAQTKYADLAIAMADAAVLEAQSSAQGGDAPQIAFDSYLRAFGAIRDITYTWQWCDALISQPQKTDWRDYCAQAIYNIWNPNDAKWYGVPFTWSGWSINNPGNNYHYSFLGATTCWAAFSGDVTWLDYLKSDRWPKLADHMADLPEGGSREGTGYGLSHKDLFEVYGIWATSTGDDVQSKSTHCRNSISYWTHATTPNGKFFAPIGDQARVSKAPVYDYNRTLIDWAVSLNSSDPSAEAGRWWRQFCYPKMANESNVPYDLLNISGIATQPAETLYQAKSAGHYFARSDWTTDATFLDFTCGTYSESHGHSNHGAFDFWGAGGWLAVTENTLTNSGLNKTPEFHNMLRFEKAGTILRQTKWSSGVAVVSDDEATLVADLDLTPLYPDESFSWKRMLTYARPSNLTVADTCSVPAGIVPIFQLQLPVKPTLTATGFTAGKLKVTVQTPKHPKITSQNWKNLSTDAVSGYRVNITDPAGTGNFVVKLQVLP